PTPEQQGVGFDRPFTWDVPLTDGYESVTVRPARAGERIDSAHFMGLDVPEIGDAIARTRPDVVLITGWYSITLVRALVAARRLAPAARAFARQAWSIDPDACVVPFGGKLVLSRRPLRVVRAVARLERGATRLGVGSGPLRTEVETEARELGVDLKLVGFL